MDFGLGREDYELFVKDAMQNSIVVGGACKNACVFCSCKAQSAACRKNWTNYISEKDLESIIDYINPNQTIFFGEGPSFLSCEPFQHPEYIKLLEILNRYFPNTSKMTTTIGKNIYPRDYDKLRNLGIKFVVSVNSLNKKTRSRVMKSEDDYDGLIRFLVECPDLVSKISLMHYGDIDVLKKDINMLYNINSSYIQEKEILLRMTDYSEYHNNETLLLHKEGKKTWYEAVRYFDKSVTRPSYWLTSLTDFPLDVKQNNYETFPSYNIHSAREDFIFKIKEVSKVLNDMNIDIEEETSFLLSESVYDFFKENFEYNSILVKNLTFKGSYRVAGLLTKHDIMNAILKEKKKKYYIGSKTAFNKFTRDLHNNHGMYDYPINLILG